MPSAQSNSYVIVAFFGVAYPDPFYLPLLESVCLIGMCLSGLHKIRSQSLLFYGDSLPLVILKEI